MTIENKTFQQSGKELTSEFQKEVLSFVGMRGSSGATDREVQGYTNRGHGSTSSALSTLHKRGYLCRLREKRERFTVYVQPQYVQGRDILPPMTNKGLFPVDHAECEATEAVLLQMIDSLKERIAELEQK